MANTESCQVEHLQYVISGRLRIAQDDGRQMDLAPGDFVHIPPGHDAWVLGDDRNSFRLREKGKATE
jgi:quercetin dioxygenase-like cupin family protein